MTTGGRNTKFVVLAVGILVVAGGISYFGGFYPPATDESTGAIGAANRYRAGQMTDRDVVLGDSQVASFMQTDTFDRIMKSEPARKLLASPEFRAAMQGEGIGELLAKPGVDKVFKEAGLVSILEALGRQSRQDRMQSRVDAELFASVMDVAARRNKPMQQDASGKARRDDILEAARRQIHEAEAGGRLDLLNDGEFLNALVAIQGDAASGARFDETQGKSGRLFYKNPEDNPNLLGVVQAIGDAEGRKQRTSILEEALGRTGKLHENWGKALRESPELHAVVLAALEANAFGGVMDEASARGGRKQQILDAAGKAFQENLGKQKYDRLFEDASAMKKVFEAQEAGGGPVVVELAALAQNEAQFNAIFDEAQGRKIYRNQDVLAGVGSLLDEANKNPRYMQDLQALAQISEAGSGVLLEALSSSRQAGDILLSGPVQSAIGSGSID